MRSRIIGRVHRAHRIGNRGSIFTRGRSHSRRALARPRALGARASARPCGAHIDALADRILRSPQRRRVQTDAAAQTPLRSGERVQSRMLRGRAVMPELCTAPATPARNVVDYELLFDCVHCGLCLEACPTYIVTRAEMDSPRGRIYLMKALAEGNLQLDDDAVRHLDLCLGCRGCETACPSGVHYGQLIEGARAFVERNHRRGVFDRLRRSAVSAIFPYPSRMRALLAP